MNKIFSFVLGCLIIATLLAGVFSPALPGVLAGGRPEEECPPQGNSGVTCDWVQHRVTGQCKWIPSHSLHWPWEKVEEGTCPDLEQKEPTPTLPAPTAPAPTDKPDPTAQPDPTEVPSTSGDPTATPSGDDGFLPPASTPVVAIGCPSIRVQGIADKKVVFTTTYLLTSPAGQVWSFGDLRVDELKFTSAIPVFLEEKNEAINSFTWVPNGFSELQFREIISEPSCKIMFVMQGGVIAP